MGLSGCMKCLKYLVFVMNFIFWLAGMAILAIGIWLRVDVSLGRYMHAGYGGDLESYYIMTYILIGAGALMSFIGFVGCCGAYQESACMLGTFSAFLTVILATELGAGVWAYINRGQIKEMGAKNFKKIIREKYGEGDMALDATINFVQKETPNNVIDNSMCGYLGSLLGNSNLHKEGCVDSLVEKLQNNLFLEAIAALSLGGLQVFGLIFSLILCCGVRSS